MRSLSVALLVLGLIGSRVAVAGEECAKACPGEKVAKLLERWASATEESKTQCPDERARIETALAAVAKECPFGSRMGKTLGFLKNVLASAVASEEAHSKDCPIARAAATKETLSPALAEAVKLNEARSKLLRDLHRLASYAVDNVPASPAKTDKTVAASATSAGSACCAEKAAGATAAKAEGLCAEKAQKVAVAVRAEKCDKAAAAILMRELGGLKCETRAGEIVAALRKEECEVAAGKVVFAAAEELRAAALKDTAQKSASTLASAAKTSSGSACCAEKGAVAASAACESSGACCGDLAACARALQASWDNAAPEYLAMCPQKRKELMATASEITGRSKVLTLLPESAMTLVEGFDALDALNGKMMDWAKANPEVMKDIPADAVAAFTSTSSLLHESAEVLHHMGKAMMAADLSAQPSKKIETAVQK